MSFRIPQSSPEVTVLVLLPPADPFPVASWVSCPGAGDRQEVAPRSFCGTLVPSITGCVLLHEAKAALEEGAGASLSIAAPTAASALQYPPSAREKPGAETFLKTQHVPPRSGCIQLWRL